MFKLLSKLYEGVVTHRNNQYNIGKYYINNCGKPLISIGNISLGGTGKTPFTLMLAKLLIEIGHYPGIIGKGYKRKSKGEIIVSDGINKINDYNICGDEMQLLADSLNIPILIHEQKYMAANAIADKFPVDLIILDDGYQHRRLHRDIDIVIIDNNTLQNPYIIPKGRLREPFHSLNRANIIVINELVDFTLFQSLYTIKQNQLLIKTKTIIERPYFSNSIINLNFHDISHIKNGVLALTAIANPGRFMFTLENQRIRIIKSINYIDHYNYTINDIKKIIAICKELKINSIATTEKDNVKLRLYNKEFMENKISLIVFPITIEIIENKQSFIDLINSIIPQVF